MRKRQRRKRRIHPLHKQAQEHIGHAITLKFNMRGEKAGEFAERVEIDPKTFYHARRGDKPISVATLAAIAIGLDVPMQELVPGYTLGRAHDEA